MLVLKFVAAATLSILAILPLTVSAAEPDKASYELTVNITWSKETAPFEFPDYSHTSGITAVTHNARYTLFRDGQIASSGLELVAENGRVAILKAELAEAMRRRRVAAVIDGAALHSVPGRVTFKFDVTKSHPLFSFVTMIAPSPDWFTGVDSVALWQNGAWVKSVTVPLWAWDSGTDNGTTYDADDIDAQPPQSIRLLAGPHFLSAKGLVPMGSAALKLVD